MLVNPGHYEYFFDVAAYLEAGDAGLVRALAGVLKALVEKTGGAPNASVAVLLDAVQAGDTERRIAEQLLAEKGQLVLLGSIALEHKAYSELRLLAVEIARLSAARLGYLPRGANSAGAALAGVLPHRGPAGQARTQSGLNAAQMIERPRNAYLLFGLEPEHDLADGAAALAALEQAEFVAVVTPFDNEKARSYADVLLPIGTFAETAGTFVNLEGRWQSFHGAAQPVGESRPGWKVLRVLGNLFEMPNFDYSSCQDVLNELHALVGDAELDTGYQGSYQADPESLAAEGHHGRGLGAYQSDALLRRSAPLQATRDGQAAA